MANFGSRRDRIKALSRFLEISRSDITLQNEDSEDFTWNYFVVDGTDNDGEYLVLTDDEANDAFHDRVENLIDDLGFNNLSENLRDWIVENALDQDWFEDYCREDCENYAYDIQNDDGDVGATRLIDECIDRGIISEDDLNEDGEYEGDLDLQEELAEYFFNDIDGDYVEWCADNFGWDWVSEVVEQGYASFDIDAIAEYIESLDGRGSELASYDGEENEYNNYYIYRN